jgi:hypothetical protein
MAPKSPQNRSPFFCGSQCSTGAVGDHFGFMFRHRRENMDRKPVRGRKIHGFKIDPRFHKVRYKSYVTGQPVKFCNHEGGFVDPACRECFGELWTVCTTPAFDLRKLADEFCAFDVGLDRMPLGLKPEAAAALL